MAVRSSLLALQAINTASITPVYTTPSGYTTLVKQVMVLNAVATAEAALLMYVETSGGTTTTVWKFPTLAQNNSAALDPCWFVLPDGYKLKFSGAQAGYRVFVSGAELI